MSFVRGRPDSIDTWLDPPISLGTWLCVFISFPLQKLLSPVTAAIRSVSKIRKPVGISSGLRVGELEARLKQGL